MEEDLEETISRCKNGCLDALENLVRQNQSMVYNTACYITANKNAAHDISCKVFSQLYETIGDCKEEIPLFITLYKLTINNSLGIFEKELNNLHDEERRYAEFQKDRAIIAMQRLTEQQRIFIVLHDVQKLSYSEISLILECPEDRVRIAIHKARQAIKQILISKKHLKASVGYRQGALNL